ncbi:hypothetical protein O181_044321 [Austropuccinia psidii MF-1]|uniref:Uncharacterized protein n=1 Tax=Austropuccinia psidii MF-1 TaxID=1389203 RepID=A0A9Q3DQ62_9BASI|nr:hypothetical protein [Austropuccinia psidii MF-1]
MKDGNGKRTFELGLIVTMSCHPWDSNSKNKTHPFHRCLASKPRGNPLQAQVVPNGWRTYPGHDEPPIPGPSSLSKPPEDVSTCEPEPEVAPTQSMEETFARPATPRSVIIINDTPIGSPPCVTPASPVPLRTLPPPPPQCQAPLIPTMTLATNLLTYG